MKNTSIVLNKVEVKNVFSVVNLLILASSIEGSLVLLSCSFLALSRSEVISENG